MRTQLAKLIRQTLFDSSRIAGSRGLAGALLEGCPSGSPWILGSIQAHSSSAAGTAGADDPGEVPPPTSGGSSAPAASVKLPPGQIDFNRRQLVMMFTCAKCETRAAKAFSKSAYTSGVVIVECPGCDARHLIADHLGWFGTKGETIEEFAAQRGGTVVSRLADNTLELTPAEVYGVGAADDDGLREQEGKQ